MVGLAMRLLKVKFIREGPCQGSLLVQCERDDAGGARMCSVRALHAACRWPDARSSLSILGALVVLVLVCWRPVCGTAAGAQSV